MSYDKTLLIINISSIINYFSSWSQPNFVIYSLVQSMLWHLEHTKLNPKSRINAPSYVAASAHSFIPHGEEKNVVFQWFPLFLT